MKQWLGLTTVALMGMVLTGCPKQPTPDQTANAPSTNGATEVNAPAGAGNTGKYKIAVIPKGTSHSFWQSVLAGAKAAGAEEGAAIIWQGPSKETDVTEQVNIVQNQVSSGVNGIVLAATDAKGLVPPVKAAIAKGVPVVTIDSGLSEDVSLCYIATDNVKGGELAADALAEAIGDRGPIGVMPFLKGAKSSDEREQGFMEGIKKHPNIKVVSTLYNDSDPAKALDQTLNMLTAHPEIKGIFAANEPGGVGAASALKQRGLVGKVKIVAYDTSKEELQALKDGTIQALIVQDPFQMGYQGVKTVMKAIKKEPITTKFIDSGVKVVTKDNLNDPEVQKLTNEQSTKKP